MGAAAAIGSSDLPAGTIAAERYRVISVLGRGGMGTVFLAEHVAIGRKVALKVLSNAWMLHGEVRRRFVAEARATARIRHPAIVDVIDAGVLDDGRPFLAMEYLDGVSLLAAVQEAGSFSIERALGVARGIADALVAAHAAGIVHRDLKSENVMLVGERVKLLDFGIAAALRDDPSARMTVPGLVIGTPAYMPPEQGRGAPATPSFDVYAVGAVLFEMLCGVTPFEQEDPLALLVEKAGAPAPSIAAKRSDLPRALVELVDACLAIAPSARPADMLEVRTRLDALVRPRRVTLRRPRRPRQRALTLSGALVIAFGWAAVTVAETSAPPVAALHLSPTIDADEPPEMLVVPHEVTTSPRVTATALADAPAARPTRRAKPTQLRPAAIESRECARTRRRARDAREAHDWEGVLRHVEDATCWGPMIERQRLRVKANLELGRFARCVELGDGGDTHVRTWVHLCRRRLDAP